MDQDRHVYKHPSPLVRDSTTRGTRESVTLPTRKSGTNPEKRTRVSREANSMTH